MSFMQPKVYSIGTIGNDLKKESKIVISELDCLKLKMKLLEKEIEKEIERIEEDKKIEEKKKADEYNQILNLVCGWDIDMRKKFVVELMILCRDRIGDSSVSGDDI